MCCAHVYSATLMRILLACLKYVYEVNVANFEQYLIPNGWSIALLFSRNYVLFIVHILNPYTPDKTHYSLVFSLLTRVGGKIEISRIRRCSKFVVFALP